MQGICAVVFLLISAGAAMAAPGDVGDMTHRFVDGTISFVRANQRWMVPVVFMLSLGESLAFVSLVLPATVILFSIAGLLGGAGVPVDTIAGVWLAGSVGAALGYATSYWIGLWFKDDVHRLWPFRSYPDMLPRGRTFFDRWGVLGIFLGHFFGPIRGVVPVIAGTLAMRQLPFQIANVTSSMILSAGIIVAPLYGVKFFAG